MILDTSCLAAIFFGEPEEEQFTRLIVKEPCKISAANYVELSMALEQQLGPDASRQCEAFFRRAEIAIEAVTVEQAHLSKQAFIDFGKGRHPAALNFGDCFAYALSRATGEPLLFKGGEFGKTDIRAIGSTP